MHTNYQCTFSLLCFSSLNRQFFLLNPFTANKISDPPKRKAIADEQIRACSASFTSLENYVEKGHN